MTVGDFAAVDAGPDQVVCAGTNQVSLSATASGATNPNNDLTWSAPSGSFSRVDRPNVTYTILNSIATGGGSVVLTITASIEYTRPVATGQMEFAWPGAGDGIAGAAGAPVETVTGKTC